MVGSGPSSLPGHCSWAAWFSLQAHYSTGKVSASFTSTAMVPETTHEAGSCPCTSVPSSAAEGGRPAPQRPPSPTQASLHLCQTFMGAVAALVWSGSDGPFLKVCMYRGAVGLETAVGAQLGAGDPWAPAHVPPWHRPHTPSSRVFGLPGPHCPLPPTDPMSRLFQYPPPLTTEPCLVPLPLHPPCPVARGRPSGSPRSLVWVGGAAPAGGQHRARPRFAAAIDEDVLRYQFVKKKGYVRLHTNKGDLNLELHCDMVRVAAVPTLSPRSFPGS